MSTKKLMDTQMRQLVRELQNVLLRDDLKEEDLCKVYDTLGELLGQLNQGILSSRFPNVQISTIQHNFQLYHYSRLLECVIKLFTIDHIKTLTSRRRGFTLEDLFLKGEPKEAFCTLCKSVTENSQGYRLQKCVLILEKFIQLDNLSNVIISQCKYKPITTKGHGQSHVDYYQAEQWEMLCTYIVTLPERVINKLQKEAGTLFFPEKYIPLVCKAILKCVEHVHSQLQSNEDCSLEFLSHLLGKLCMCGHGEQVWTNLLPQLQHQVSGSALWCRICERLVCGVPDRYMESVLTPLLQAIPWFRYMGKFLGHSVLENQKVKFLLTNKLLLLRHFKKHEILQNILGYISESGTLKSLFLKTLLKLLEVWGDKSALKHTSYEQHLYITKALMVSTAFLKEKDVPEIEGDAIQKLMTGVGIHLDSSLPLVRRQGMMVAEALTQKLNKHMEKLKFEYEEDGESKELKGLLVIPECPDLDDLQRKMLDTNIQNHMDKDTTDKELNSDCNIQHMDEDLDSDDDFEPYDLSNDTKQRTNKPPVFIRDCMEGLISSGEDPDRFEVCLQVAEKLVKQHITTAKEVSVEFVKVLLHLQDNFNLPEFTILRHRAMVALLVVDPVKVADYLTGQFYERNYNIRQRLDILEVLCTAAKELSDPSKDTFSRESLRPESGSVGSTSDKREITESEHWKDIVQRRIDSKTRRFISKKDDKKPIESANRFAPVAGNFIFPLLAKFDRKENTLDMLGDDHIVLGRLVYTFGVIIYQAQHAPICRSMGKSLLEFIWALRYHPQPSIKQSLLFSTCMVLLALPAHILLVDLQDQVIETKTWLQDVAEGDSDQECQKMAVQALIVLENTAKEQFSKEVT